MPCGERSSVNARRTHCESPRPVEGQSQGAAAPRHVPAAVAVYRRQHRRRLLLHHRRPSRRSAATRKRIWIGRRSPSCSPFLRRAGRAHRPHDQHHKRIWQGTGFAGRRDHVWRGAQPAGVRLGISLPARFDQSAVAAALDAGGRIHLFSVSALRRVAAGALQHQPRCAAAQSRAGRGANILSACRFPRPRGCWPLRCTSCYGISRAGLVGRDSVAGPGGADRLPDGEHLALLVGQGDQLLPQPSLPAAVAAGDRALCHAAVFAMWSCFWLALAYMFSGIWARAAYWWSRRRRRRPLRRRSEPDPFMRAGRKNREFTDSLPDRQPTF